MPASNSEARKRHEAAAATTDAMAEALSNVASGVVLEALPTPKPTGGLRCWSQECAERCPVCNPQVDR